MVPNSERRHIIRASPRSARHAPTLLPQGRGRAAIPWAIIKRLTRTGVTLFQLDDGVDTGPIIDQIEIPMAPTVTASILYRQVESAHVELMAQAFPLLADNKEIGKAQDNSIATEWAQRRPEDGEIDLGGSVEDAECLVRALTHPYPGAFTTIDGVKRKIWSAHIASASEIAKGDETILHLANGALMCTDWEECPHQ